MVIWKHKWRFLKTYKILKTESENKNVRKCVKKIFICRMLFCLLFPLCVLLWVYMYLKIMALTLEGLKKIQISNALVWFISTLVCFFLLTKIIQNLLEWRGGRWTGMWRRRKDLGADVKLWRHFKVEIEDAVLGRKWWQTLKTLLQSNMDISFC